MRSVRLGSVHLPEHYADYSSIQFSQFLFGIRLKIHFHCSKFEILFWICRAFYLFSSHTIRPVHRCGLLLNSLRTTTQVNTFINKFLGALTFFLKRRSVHSVQLRFVGQPRPLRVCPSSELRPEQSHRTCLHLLGTERQLGHT